jgi:saccharopine dehydrogenase-like NADP-dependent oxidoreductase
MLDRPDVRVRVASLEGAEELVAGHENAEAVPLNADDEANLGALIEDADLAVSLLPPPFHPRVARLCIRHRTPMVTTSYVGDEMKALDGEAKKAGVIILNETGVDPGLDHMTALRTIHRVTREGGRIESFRSHCGGLPAPEANDNPLGYKFSWAPRGVLVAALRPARYLLDGEEIPVPDGGLFGHSSPLDLKNDGIYESYPNGNALNYIPIYGLESAHTVYRGTLRYPGHCHAWQALLDLEILDETERDVTGLTWSGLMRDLAGVSPDAPARAAVAAHLGLGENNDAIERLAWLGLFDDDPLGVDRSSPLDLLATRMLDRMQFAEGERDLIVMHHEFEVAYETRRERVTMTLTALGERGGDSAMARTVGLPAAVAARMVLEGRVSGAGVRIPVEPDVYEPILAELEGFGIAGREKSAPLI